MLMREALLLQLAFCMHLPCLAAKTQIGINLHLRRYSVWFADLVTPVSTPDWNQGHLGQNDGTPDCGSDLHITRAGLENLDYNPKQAIDQA